MVRYSAAFLLAVAGLVGGARAEERSDRAAETGQRPRRKAQAIAIQSEYPTYSPSSHYPTYSPSSHYPTYSPTEPQPTKSPTPRPTRRRRPTPTPTKQPTPPPTRRPTPPPTVPAEVAATPRPSKPPTPEPSESPTPRPSTSPTSKPTTSEPSGSPTSAPSRSPTVPPRPTKKPKPTYPPTKRPTLKPTKKPTPKPTQRPSISPTYIPTRAPSEDPTSSPSDDPTRSPTYIPTRAPSEDPTSSPSDDPTRSPSISPTEEPTFAPSLDPTPRPTGSPTKDPTPPPTNVATNAPTPSPTPYETSTRIWDSGDRGGTRYRNYLIGLSNFNSNPENRPIVLILTTGSDELSYFVGFNDRQVTVSRATSSFKLEAVLDAGQSHVVPNWRGTMMDLVITAEVINFNAKIRYAVVAVAFGPDSVAPTDGPTAAPTPSPTPNPGGWCGDGVCGAGEDPKKCGSDCAPGKFHAGRFPDALAGGHMFDVGATATGVRITSFEVSAPKYGKGYCSVYTRPGRYLGHEEDEGAWELLSYKWVELYKDSPTSVGKLGKGVSIPAGARQAFHIWCQNPIPYTTRKQKWEGRSFGSDGAIVIYTGRTMKNRFQPSGWGQISVGISYIATAPEDELI